MSLTTILLIVALICFVAAAVGWSYRKVNLLGAGLALLVLAQILGGVHL
jgi:hypothetical protein